MNKLIYSPDGNNYSVNDSPNRLTANYGVAGIFSRDLINDNQLVNVSWAVPGSIYNYLTQVYRWFINSGGVSFLCDLEIDETNIVTVECKFVLGSFKLNSVQGLTYNVSAILSVSKPKYDVVNRPWVVDSSLQRAIIHAGKGTYILSGKAVNFHLSHIHAIMPTGVYHLTGRDADLAKKLLAPSLDTGIYLLTGQNADFTAGVVAGLETGVYTLTGQNATLTHSIPVSGAWNVADQTSGGPYFILSGGDKIADAAIVPVGPNALIRGITPRSSGKFYFEVVSTFGAFNSSWGCGVCDAGMSLSSGRPGIDFTGGHFGLYYLNSNVVNQTGHLAFDLTSISGTVVGIGVDFTANQFSIYRNGVLMNTYSMDAAATLYPCASAYTPDITTDNVYEIHSLSGNIAALPSGYTAWG